MQKSHDDNLTRRLETILDTGIVFIHWAELCRWYERQRITSAVHNDLLQRWEELTKNKYGDLVSVRGPANEGMWLFTEKSMSKVRDF